MPLFPPFRLDKVNQTLWRQTASSAEQPVFLNPKAFALLRTVSQNTNVKLRDLAATIVTSVSGEPPKLTAPFEDG